MYVYNNNNNNNNNNNDDDDDDDDDDADDDDADQSVHDVFAVSWALYVTTRKSDNTAQHLI